MQANRPRPRLTFTSAVPAELPRPDYRLVLVFDSAIDLTAARVCAGEVRHQPRQVEAAGRFAVFAVYCRNDLRAVAIDRMDAGDRSGGSAGRSALLAALPGDLHRRTADRSSELSGVPALLSYGANTSASGVPPCAKRGEVAPSYGDGGVMGRTDAVAHDPSVARIDGLRRSSRVPERGGLAGGQNQRARRLLAGPLIRLAEPARDNRG